jgi:hypothetical protein
LLGERKFMTAPSGRIPTSIQVGHRAIEREIGEANPARPKTTKAASTQNIAANALAIRRPFGSRTWDPFHAARPSGAPRARASWKTAMAKKPIAAATAAVPAGCRFVVNVAIRSSSLETQSFAESDQESAAALCGAASMVAPIGTASPRRYVEVPNRTL